MLRIEAPVALPNSLPRVRNYEIVRAEHDPNVGKDKAEGKDAVHAHRDSDRGPSSERSTSADERDGFSTGLASKEAGEEEMFGDEGVDST